jgi:hypothetical protein
MHNSRFMIDVVMPSRERDHAYRTRHPWKRPPAPKPQGLIRRAMATLRH